MDSAAIRSKNRRSRAVKSAAWQGASELLEQRTLLSDATAGVDTTIKSFIENRGQWDSQVRYALPSSAGNIYITDNGPVYQLIHTAPDGTKTSEAFFVSFDGSNSVRPTGLDKAAGVTNFFSGDSSNWKTNVPGYDKIAYKGIYDGVDLYTWGKNRSLKYEFHVAPGADWTQVQVSYAGIQGLTIDDQGRLHVRSAGGEFIDNAPVVYQVIDGKQVVVASSFRLVDNDTYTFALNGSYDPRYELVLDPVIDWSTYFGAPNEDHINAVATATGGGQVVAYVAGYTENGLIFPSESGIALGSPIVPYTGGNDAFVAKFGSNGQMIWFTFLGGSVADDQANDMVVDGLGRVVVVGQTSSSDFVFTAGAWQTSLDNDNNAGTTGTSAFLARLSPNGDLQYASFYGGTGTDIGRGVDVDADNNIYMVGSTQTNSTLANPNTSIASLLPDLITTTTRQGGQDGFIAKMNIDQIPNRIWGRYLGGTGAGDTINKVDVTPAGDIFVVGTTNSNNNNSANPPVSPGSTAHMVTIGSFQPTYGGGNSDAFVSRINTNGVLVWGTYLGGGGADTGADIAIRDNLSQLAVTGQTGSTDFNVVPLRNAPPNPTNSLITLAGVPLLVGRQGTNDAFVARFNLTGGALMSSYLGGTGNNDEGTAIAYRGSDLFIVGTTNSLNFPFFDNSGYIGTQPVGYLGGLEVFVLKLKLDNSIEYAFPFGGTGDDEATGVSIDGAGAIWVVGFTDSVEAPTSTDFGFNLGQYRTDGGLVLPSFIDVFAGEDDGFIAHFSDATNAAPVAAPSNVHAVALSMSEVRVTWSDNSNNETGFLIRRKLGTNGPYVTVATVGPNVRTFDDSGLLPETTYYYVIYSFNLTGFSTPTAPAGVTTRTSAVGAPTNLVAVGVSSGRIDLTWVDNADNESNFEIYRSEENAPSVLINTIGPNLTSYTDTDGLSPGTVYTYRIRATNQFRTSNFSNDASTSTSGGAFIIPPTNLVGIPLTATSVQLGWVDNSDNELGFSIERSIFGTGVFNEIGTTAANETTFIDGHVVPGTNYTYRVRAFSGLSFSAYTNTANSDPALSLATPTLVEARATSSGSILVSWFDKAQIETGYIIERAIGQASDFQPLVTTAANSTSFMDTGLLPRTRYYYRVAATDGTNVGAKSPAASATTLATGFFPPETPTVIRGKALSFSSIRVTWQDNSSTETAFSIERATVLDGPYVTVSTVPANTTLFDDQGLQDGTMYYYRIVARAGTTESLPSTVIKVRTIVKARVVVNAVDNSGGEPSNRIVFNIRRKDTFDGNLVIYYGLSGTATNGTDYTKLSGQVVIPNGQQTVDVIVTPKDDTKVEGTETVTLTLVNNVNYKVSPSLRSASGTIADNDGAAASRLRTSSRTASSTTSNTSTSSLIKSPFGNKVINVSMLLDGTL